MRYTVYMYTMCTSSIIPENEWKNDIISWDESYILMDYIQRCQTLLLGRFWMMACTNEEVVAVPPTSWVKTCNDMHVHINSSVHHSLHVCIPLHLYMFGQWNARVNNVRISYLWFANRIENCHFNCFSMTV